MNDLNGIPLIIACAAIGAVGGMMLVGAVWWYYSR